MGFTISARVVFDAGKAVLGLGKVQAGAKAAKDQLGQLGAKMSSAGNKLNNFAAGPRASASVMNLKQNKSLNMGASGPVFMPPSALKPVAQARGPTKFQRDVKLANESVRSLVQVSAEARKVMRVLGISFGDAGHGASRAARSVQVLNKGLQTTRQVATSVKSGFDGLLPVVAGVFGAIGAGKIFSDLSSFFTGSVKLAQNMEDARVTFDVMLGSSEKSSDLLNRAVQFANKTPFQKADIIEASKTLLRVTRDNVDENEKLFKLSANIAALKPGRKVADVGLGIAQASVGEFEILKGFGIKLSAKMFKNAGEVGSAQYVETVNKTIAAKFQEMTGGRDLVGMLAETLTGKVSTLGDAVENVMLIVGQKMVSGLGIKAIVTDGIKLFEQLGEALEIALSGKGRRGAFKGLPPGMVSIAKFLGGMIKRMIQIKDVGVAAVSKLWDWWNKLSSSQRENALTMGGIAAGMSTILGIAAPIIAAITTIGAAVMSVFSGTGILMVLGAFANMMLYMVPLTVLLGSSFMLFRKPGESMVDTLKRGWQVMKDFGKVASAVGQVFFLSMAKPIIAALIPAWKELQTAFSLVREQLAFILTEFGDAGIGMDSVAGAGETLGMIITAFIVTPIKLATFGLRAMSKAMQDNRPGFKNIISDLRRVAKAFIDLVAGVGDAKTNLKTFLLGVADVITLPFRVGISTLFDFFGTTLTRMEEMVRPISDSLANRIGEAAAAAHEASKTVSEGFLETADKTKGLLSDILDVKIGGEIRTAQPIVVKMDGKTIAEGTAETEMRARNAGRGGDPMTPEEMGFVLEGNKIRTVNLNEVGGRS